MYDMVLDVLHASVDFCTLTEQNDNAAKINRSMLLTTNL